MKRTWQIERAAIRQPTASGYIVIWVLGKSNGVHSWQTYSKAQAEAIARGLNEQQEGRNGVD